MGPLLASSRERKKDPVIGPIPPLETPEKNLAHVRIFVHTPTDPPPGFPPPPFDTKPSLNTTNLTEVTYKQFMRDKLLYEQWENSIVLVRLTVKKQVWAVFSMTKLAPGVLMPELEDIEANVMGLIHRCFVEHIGQQYENRIAKR